MQAIIFADRLGQELSPLNQAYCPALLPLLNRPLLDYTLVQLALAGIKDITLVVSEQSQQIKQYFADGTMWGLQIRYLLSRGEEHPNALIERLEMPLQTPFIALRGDIYHDLCISDLVKRGQQQDASIVFAGAANKNAGMALVNQLPVDLGSLSWPLIDKADHQDCWLSLTGQCDQLLELKDFHRLSMHLLEQQQLNDALPGRQLDQDIHVDSNVRLHSRNHQSGKIVIGEQTILHRSVRLQGPAVIGGYSNISAGVNIRHSIILPHTHVGEGLLVENAILAGKWLIRPEQDLVMEIEDKFILADISTEIKSLSRQLPESAVAVILAIMSLWLWPVAMLLSFAASPSTPRTGYQILRNTNQPVPGTEASAVRAWVWSTSVPILRHLPLLWWVIKGDLRLFGCPSQALMQSSHCAAGSAGLLGPRQLYLKPGTPAEEIQLNEIEFSQQAGLLIMFKRLLQASRLLFKRETWSHSKNTDGALSCQY